MPTIIQVYWHGLRRLSSNKAEVVQLTFFSVLLTCLQFSEPLILGKLIELLSNGYSGQKISINSNSPVFWLGLWLLIALAVVILNTYLALSSDKLAHKHRLLAITDYAEAELNSDRSTRNKMHSGRTTKTMLQGADNLFSLWISFFRGHIEVIGTLVFLVPLTLFVNLKLGLLLSLLSLFFIIITVRTVTKTEHLQQEIEEQHTVFIERTADAVTHKKIIKSFGSTSSEINDLKNKSSGILNAQTPVLHLWAFASVLSRSSSTLFVTAILALGIWLHTQNDTNVGQIVSFIGFASVVSARLDQLASFVSQLIYQAPSISQFFAVLNQPSNKITNEIKNYPLKIFGEVIFTNVSVIYDNNKIALNDVSFKIKAGEHVALIGHTGAGKSTVLSLIFGNIRPDKGSVSIDGLNINNLSDEFLNENVSVVFQDTFLLARSIEENLRIAAPQATHEELNTALKLAGAQFVFALKNGIQTVLGENGEKLSGGERQRLCIARAFLKNSPILILDEATSAVDTYTEQHILSSVNELMKGRTCIITTHRMSILKNVDRILLFEEGKLVQEGNYDALSKSNGLFSMIKGH